MKLLTNRELRAILWLVPILAVGCYVAWRTSFPPIDIEPTSINSYDTIAIQSPQDTVTLFEFDPNTVEFFDLCRMGFSRNQALSIIKYRERGKIFEIPEDFASCYAVDESTYKALRPYINIDKKYALKPFDKKPSHSESKQTNPKVELFEFMPDTASINTFQRLGLSQRQAEVVIKYREMIGGFHAAEEFEKCYVISKELAEKVRPYAHYKEEEINNPFPIDINSADSATLCKIVGIGAKSAEAIIKRRIMLGGFYSVEQLAEIPQITERNYERILSQICVDTCKITKININFAPAKELMAHPYFTPLQVRKLFKERQLKGGWCSLQDFLNNKILTEQEKAKVAPYLIFRCENQ